MIQAAHVAELFGGVQLVRVHLDGPAPSPAGPLRSVQVVRSTLGRQQQVGAWWPSGLVVNSAVGGGELMIS